MLNPLHSSCPRYLLYPHAHGARGRVSIQAFLADKDHNTGIAIVVCPGGSYSWLDMKAEGIDVARWLQQAGVNVYLLKYRVATVAAYITGFRVLGFGNKYPDMLDDIEVAMAYVYSHVDEHHLNPSMIGVMGFSAGGHLAMLSYICNRTPYKPTFLCPIYPVVTMSNRIYTHKRSRRGALGVWKQWDPVLQDQLSIEKHIPSDCPPVFLVNCADDPIVPYHNALLLDQALTQQHIPHLYIQYLTGGHGFGASSSKGTAECRHWKEHFLTWLWQLNQSRL